MIKLAALVRAHRRADTLRVVLSELQRYKTFGLDVRVHTQLDRPTPEVEDVAEELSDWYSPLDFPVLDVGRERFLEAQNEHLHAMEVAWEYSGNLEGPDWVYVVDDDFWFEPTQIDNFLLPMLLSVEVDAYYCPCVFIQDAPDTYNPDRQHESIRLYRHVRGARFTGKRMLSMPDGPHDAAVISGRFARFPVPLLEYGGFSEADRRHNLEAYRRAGKDDDFTRALNSPRRLRFPADYDPAYGPWQSLYP